MATQTAAQTRTQAKNAYDVYLAQCPSRNLLDRISDKWVALILVALGAQDRRFSELAHIIAGVSQKMLTQTLRSLERDGLVHREMTLSVPVRVDYSLTPVGRSLLPILESVKDWAEKHMDQVLAARAAYDKAH